MPDSLKPCPCCGGEAKLEQYRADGLRIQCRTCALKREQRWMRYSREWLEKSMIDDWNRRALPAPAAGEPELPEPFIAMQDRPWGGHAEVIRSAIGEPGVVSVYSLAQLHAYGQAMAEHARRAAMEEAVQAAADVDEPAWHGYECPNTFQDGVSAAIAAIRAAAPPQGEQT